MNTGRRPAVEGSCSWFPGSWAAPAPRNDGQGTRPRPGAPNPRFREGDGIGSPWQRSTPAMKFGIFYELQLPRPWEPEGELTLYHNALDQLELADRLDYDFAWEVEHHFLEEYSHSPAPEVFLAAASQRTRQIRLAHGHHAVDDGP